MHSILVRTFNTLSLLSAVSCASLSPRQSGETFSLFAYGNGIGGFPVFYMDGGAYIGDQQQANNSSVPVFFTDSNSAWIANPNTTETGSNATFSDATFFVPSSTSSSHQVGFLTDNSTSTDVITSGFTFYGHVALLVDSTGAWQTLFYASPTSSDGIWALNWNATGVADAIPVTVKDTTPPSQPVREKV